MSLINNIWRENIWDEITEDRDKYFVTYIPINLKEYNFAQLHLTFTSPLKPKDVFRNFHYH